MLQHVVRWAEERDLQVELWVADGNDAARRVYERYGFRADGVRAPLRPGSPLRKTRLVLRSASA